MGDSEWGDLLLQSYKDGLNYTADVDMVNSPPHYNKNGLETIDYIDSRVPDAYSYYFGNAIKYLDRHLDKSHPIKDLQKCKWYIDKMIEDLK